MSRPPVNINTVQTTATEIRTTLKNGTVHYSSGVGNLAKWVNNRPATVSTPPVFPGNVRKPTAWYNIWHNVRVTGRTGFDISRNPGVFPATPVNQQYSEGGGWYRSVLIPNDIPAAPSWLEQACIIKCLSKLQDQDVDVGVFLAESSEFAHTVTTTMVRIAKDVRGFRTRWPKSWKRVLAYDRRVRAGKHRTFVNELPSQWLGMVYGWIPSMQDCYGLMSALDKRNQVKNFDVRVVGRKSAPCADSVSTFSTLGVGASGCNLRTTVRFSAKVQVELWYKLRNETLALMSSLGLINPGLIVWEKLPYSFVVDWFIPVSGWINSLSAAAGYDFVTGCYSETVRAIGADRRVIITDPYLRVDDGESYSTLKIGRFRRSVYAASPVPGLYFKNPISTVHVANALALLRNAFKP